ncbi:phage tail protein [Enterobacter kobei]|uniref:phage tail-collar fiber domain-containing protein n=1 Tax=Enterobacter TaxID=547 RepID=UPI001F151250|nr:MULTISPECIES: phage tail protein [Enterobacter]
MSQTAITLAFEQWKASQAVTGEPVLLDEFVFANVPGLDVSKPIDRKETLPPAAQIVHRQAVSRKGVVNENAVVHSVVLGADVGDFSFNWIGLINKASNTLAMIVHAPLQQKLKTKDGQQGNVLTRSFLMEYNGAQVETGINTPAETWQIDFTARMAGMDERQRLENIDLYGSAAFLGNGWLVAKNGSQFYVTAGTGYVRGLRAQLAANQNITVTTKPVKVWLDVAWTGTLTSVWSVASKITLAANLADYVQNGVQHYVFAVASIDASGNITDLRPKGTLNEQAASDALKKHEQSRNHPDATTSAKGFTQLSSEVNSVSESLAATPKAIKTVNDDLTGLKKSLGTSSTEDIVTTKDDTTAGRVPVVGWMGLGGVAPRSKQAANSSYDSIPAGLPSGFWTHTVSGGPFAYSFALQQDGGGVNNTRHFIMPADTNGKIAIRWDDGATFRYQYFYTDKNKPTPADVGAVDKKGDTMSGPLKVGAEVQSTSANSFRMAYGDYGAFWRNDGSNLYLMLTNQGDAFGNYNALRPLRVSLNTGAVVSESPLTVTDTVTASKEVTAGYTGAFAFAEQYRTKAPFFNSYVTAGVSEYHPALKQLATINGKNSWAFSMGSLVSGDVLSWHLQMKGGGGGDVNFKWDVDGNFFAPGRVYPGNFSNFDDRYIQKDGCHIAGFASGDATRPYMRHAGSSLVVYLAKTGDSYTKAESDNGYAAKTNVYTKAESDGRFQPKGSYGAPNSASKAANGWWQCGSTGIIEQWCQGATMTSETTQTITFPKAFPNACLHVEVGTLNVNNSNDTEGMFQLISKSNTGCVVRANRAYGSIGQVAALIRAKGY